jgi:hypothetical protein
VAYDALKRGRDLLTTACETSLSGYIATVATEHGVTVSAPRAVYRAQEARPMYPNIEVSPPQGSLESLSHGNIATGAAYWLIASYQSADPLYLDDALMVAVTAIIRMCSSLDGSAYLVEPVEFSFSPPMFTDDTQQKQSVGVLVQFSFAESV